MNRVVWDLSTLEGDADRISIINNRINIKYDDEYLGKVNNIITVEELHSLLDLSQGNDVYTGDITWLKFKTFDGIDLLVASKCTRSSISYNHLELKGIVKTISSGYNPASQGKIITINGIHYKCRLLTGGNANPAASGGGEWDRFIVRFTPNNADSNWSNISTWCQEVRSGYTALRVIRGYNYVSRFDNSTASNADADKRFRPVLEIL